jgi:1-acyl-sn-glycerol-3-phosphate acyltransferase
MILKILKSLVDEWVFRAGFVHNLQRVFGKLLLSLPALFLAPKLRYFDRIVKEKDLCVACDWLLHQYYSGRVTNRGTVSLEGPLLVVCNHPGMMDAVSVLSVIDRKDLQILVTDKEVYRSLPHIAPYLITLPESTASRFQTVRSIVESLKQGKAIVVFPSGHLEPDPAFCSDKALSLKEWSPLVGFLCRQARRQEFNFRILPVLVSQVLPRWVVGSDFIRDESTLQRTINLTALGMILARLTKKLKITVTIGASMDSSGLLSRSADPFGVTSMVRNALIELAEAQTA